MDTEKTKKPKKTNEERLAEMSEADKQALVRLPESFPVTVEDLEGRNPEATPFNVNALCQGAFKAVLVGEDGPELRRVLYAIDKDQAKHGEGTLSLNFSHALEMIRNHERRENINSPLATAPLSAVANALRAVLKKHKLDRQTLLLARTAKLIEYSRTPLADNTEGQMAAD